VHIISSLQQSTTHTQLIVVFTNNNHFNDHFADLHRLANDSPKVYKKYLQTAGVLLLSGTHSKSSLERQPQHLLNIPNGKQLKA